MTLILGLIEGVCGLSWEGCRTLRNVCVEGGEVLYSD